MINYYTLVNIFGMCKIPNTRHSLYETIKSYATLLAPMLCGFFCCAEIEMIKRKYFDVGYTKIEKGYRFIYDPDNFGSNCQGFITEHRLVVQKAIKGYLPLRFPVHHVDGNKLNNSNNNLVICQDTAYHSLLHQRERTLRACGNVNHRKCTLCHKYDDSKNMTKNRYHRECRAISNQKGIEKRKKLRMLWDVNYPKQSKAGWGIWATTVKK